MEHSTSQLNQAADNIRVLIASMVEKANSGHPGGAMGGADFINLLYSEFLRFDPDNHEWECRDRFFLDPGHMSPMLYSQLMLCDYFTMDELKEFRQWGAPTHGHPERNIQRGIENTSGPLGQGHAYAVGAAIGAKLLYARTGNPGFDNETIYAYISDGGIQEEISQGAGRIAGHLGLNNLIMFYDSNKIQLSTPTSEVFSEDTAMKYRAWNWFVIEIDGNDPIQIREALKKAKEEPNRPTLIIGHTIMGKGARKADGSSYEGVCDTHGAPLSSGSYIETIKNLGGDPGDPFKVWPEVQQLYRDRIAELRQIVSKCKEEEEEWKIKNPEKAKILKNWLLGKLSNIPWDSIQVKANDATRNGSKEVLKVLSEYVPNMIVSSADLSNSDKTDGFLAHTSVISRTNFSGGFLQVGVSELTMCCLCIGISLHGGLIAAMGTFFVFSDYMKPAIRMAALMKLPVKFIWSHDAFRVGEDGPTHEPVEQEAQIRLMEKLKNHLGEDSVRVLRPADNHETIISWKIAMENIDTPTALILSRQAIKDLPKDTNYMEVYKGAYKVVSDENPDVILLASGSEVSTLIDATQLLQEASIKVSVISCPSEGLFRRQSKDYQQKLLPKTVKKFALTAGLPVTMESLVGDEGKVYGLDSFGFSAPYKVLDEKLGFTARNIAKEVMEYINKV